MKKYILILILFLTLLSVSDSGLVAQPPPSQNPSQDGDPVGTSIGSGLVILLALGAGYGVVKIKQHRKRQS